MNFFLPTALLLLSLLATGAIPLGSQNKHMVPRQAPNTVSSMYPSNQTASYNLTAWLVPITNAQATSMAGGKSLIHPTGLPGSFSITTGQHLMLIVNGYFFDIRQLNLLTVQELSSIEVYIPWVDGNNDGSTPYLYNYKGYLDQLIPTLVGNLVQSAASVPGIFDPAHAAYKAIGSSTLSFNVDFGIPGGLLGLPGLTSPVQGSLQTFSSLTSSGMSFSDAQGISGTAEWITPTQGYPCSTYA
ncbi:unnamed protein product [Tilletia caries]|nr:unnamed protein product [Tilletia caries]